MKSLIKKTISLLDAFFSKFENNFNQKTIKYLYCDIIYSLV